MHRDYAFVNSLKMYYEIHGAGRPLVLLHGGLTTIDSSFGEILPILANTRQVVAVEQQGHGHTADLDRPLTFEQMADDTAALLRQIEIESADFFGWSDGGNIALQIALRHPSLVRRLMISGTNYNNDGFDSSVLRAFQDLTPAGMPKVLAEAYARTAPDPKQWPILIDKVKKLALEFKGWRPEDIQSIDVPVLVMIGDRDIVRPEHAVQMFRLLPNAQLAVLPGTDHNTLARPDWVLPMMAAFLDGPVPPPRVSP